MGALASPARRVAVAALNVSGGAPRALRALRRPDAWVCGGGGSAPGGAHCPPMGRAFCSANASGDGGAGNAGNVGADAVAGANAGAGAAGASAGGGNHDARHATTTTTASSKRSRANYGKVARKEQAAKVRRAVPWDDYTGLKFPRGDAIAHSGRAGPEAKREARAAKQHARVLYRKAKSHMADPKKKAQRFIERGMSPTPKGLKQFDPNKGKVIRKLPLNAAQMLDRGKNFPKRSRRWEMRRWEEERRKRRTAMEAKAKEMGFKRGKTWRLVVSTAVERLPIIMRDPEQWEIDFWAWSEERQLAKSRTLPTGVMTELEGMRQPIQDDVKEHFLWKRSPRPWEQQHDAAGDGEDVAGGAKGAEDHGQAEEGAGEKEGGEEEEGENLADVWDEDVDEDDPFYVEDPTRAAARAEAEAAAEAGGGQFEVMPRVTIADESGDVRTPDRRLKERVYLLVKKQRRHDDGGAEKEHVWQFPQGGRKVEDAVLLDSASRYLHDVCGPEFSYYNYGDAPHDYWFYEYPPERQKSSGYFGCLVFLHRAFLKCGFEDLPALTTGRAAEKEREALAAERKKKKKEKKAEQKMDGKKRKKKKKKKKKKKMRKKKGHWSRPTDVVDFAWVAKDELGDYLQGEALECAEKFL